MTLILIQTICPVLLLFSFLLVPGSTHNRFSVPEFDVPLPNLTVKQGSDAAFTCIVKHLQEYKVAWIRSEDKAILAFHTTMVIHNHRFFVTHNGHNTWTLHIKNVQKNDTGSYLCQVNTDPQRSQYGILEVVVPADIIDAETSSDVVVREGHSTTLKCKATGSPPPKVRWKRQDGQPLPISREALSGSPIKQTDSWDGEILPLKPLMRSDTGAYLCIANNSVPPSISKRIYVFVHFEPLIKVLTQLVGTPVGDNITIFCIIEALPRAVVSWYYKGQLILSSPDRHFIETEIINDYQVNVSLRIANIRKEDFGDYNCTAGNSLGSNHGLIKLQQVIPLPTLPPTTTTTQIDRRMKPGTGKHSEHERERLSDGKHKTNPWKKKQKHHGNHHEGNGEFEDFERGIGDGVTTASSSSGSGANNKLRTLQDGNSRNLESPNLSSSTASSSFTLISLPSLKSSFSHWSKWSLSLNTLLATSLSDSETYQNHLTTTYHDFDTDATKSIIMTQVTSSKYRLPLALIPSLLFTFVIVPLFVTHCQ